MTEEPNQVSSPIGASTVAQSQQEILEKSEQIRRKINDLPDSSSDLDRALLKHSLAETQVGLGQSTAAWNNARAAMDVFIENKQWESAVHACDTLYQCDLEASLVALMHGIWLAVSFPIEPRLSVMMLSYILEETQDSADGAAVAAVVAHYIVGMRTQGKEQENLSFITTNMIGRVAERHSNVKTQDALNIWLEKLELNDPAIFLPRMSLVVNALAGDTWWFDKDEIRASFSE